MNKRSRRISSMKDNPRPPHLSLWTTPCPGIGQPPCPGRQGKGTLETKSTAKMTHGDREAWA